MRKRERGGRGRKREHAVTENNNNCELHGEIDSNLTLHAFIHLMAHLQSESDRGVHKIGAFVYMHTLSCILWITCTMTGRSCS